jgi:hypothetical protein
MTMLARDAKAVAGEWVRDTFAGRPGVIGAYFAGSVGWLPDDAPLPDTSDLDVSVVLSEGVPARERAKLLVGGVLLEVSYLPVDVLDSPSAVLGDYHLAGAFRAPSVILDPSGRLSELQAAVLDHFADASWVRRRCEHARDHALRQLAALDTSKPLPELSISWLFPTGVTTHVLLVAGLRNPTVRRRYAEVRRLLADYGRLPFHEDLLDLLGCAQMAREAVARHLAAMAAAFDAACAYSRTPFPFSADISGISRRIAVDGSRELVQQGLQREAMFWIAVTHSRCHVVLSADAPSQVIRGLAPAYRELLEDLGIGSAVEVRRRADVVRDSLSRVWEVAEEIMARNQGAAPSG